MADAKPGLVKTPLKTLRVPRFQQAAVASNEWFASIESGHTLADVMVPEYWGHFSDKLRPFDKIKVGAEDGSFYAELIVRRTGRAMAIVDKLLSIDLTPDTSRADALVESNNYDVKYTPATKWRVIRKSDRDCVGDGYESEAAARTWLVNEYLKDRPKAA